MSDPKEGPWVIVWWVDAPGYGPDAHESAYFPKGKEGPMRAHLEYVTGQRNPPHHLIGHWDLSDAARAPAMRDWITKICDHFERQAARNREHAETCYFETLTSGYLADAENYERMVRDGRRALGGEDE